VEGALGVVVAGVLAGVELPPSDEPLLELPEESLDDDDESDPLEVEAGLVLVDVERLSLR